jgi:hypothetical protein
MTALTWNAGKIFPFLVPTTLALVHEILSGNRFDWGKTFFDQHLLKGFFIKGNFISEEKLPGKSVCHMVIPLYFHIVFQIISSLMD